MAKPSSPPKDSPSGRVHFYRRIQQARSLGLNPYPDRCHPKTAVSEILQRVESGESGPFRAAGRLSGIRPQDDGRSIALSDFSGSLTFRLHSDGTSPESRKTLEFLRAGDIIEALVRPSNGEFAAEEVRLLAPSLQAGEAGATPFPEPGILRLRARVMRTVREFFDGRGFLEVETPALLSAPDPAPHLVSFVTEYADARGKWPLYLQTSPELPMKRLLGAGHERIYQITRFFRNGERTSLHNPEFTGLEWYEAYADYRSAMETAEALVCDVARRILGQDRLQREGKTIDLRPPWERISVREAFLRYSGIDPWARQNRDELAASARSVGIHVAGDDGWEDLFFKISLERVEPNLGRTKPTLLFDYPAPLALLAKRKAEEPSVAERFEVFAGGMELANGFTELNDPEEQRARWERELEVRRRENPDASPPLDEAFLQALEAGVPPAAGVALGLDRLVMLLADRRDIGEVRCFAFDREG